MSKKIILLLILFFPIFITGSLVSAEESESSENSVREKVREKIETVLNKPKAYLGTITDKTEDTLQIKNLKGEIQFISISSDKTAFINVGTTNKTIKYTDVGLGDFVTAMGIQKFDDTNKENGNSVLDAKRILISKEVQPTNRKVVFGKVVKIEKKILYLNTENQDYEYEFPKKWKGPEIEELSEDDRVVIVAISTEGKYAIRTLEILSSTSPKE